jgi:glycosyltransferase involved in cell wall biosynthesis
MNRRERKTIPNFRIALRNEAQSVAPQTTLFPLRVVHLNTYHTTGGAAVAAGRLNRALNRFGLDSTLLVQETTYPEENVEGLATSFLAQKMAFARFGMERALFLPYEKDKAARFQFSPATTGVDLTFNSTVRQADVLHLHWINFGFFSVEGLQRLMALEKPVVWTMHDMWPFTGGCHHSGTCENYQRTCGNCVPFLRNPGPNDLSHSGWVRKQQAYETAHLVPVGCSEWLANRARKSGLFRNVPVLNIPNPIDTTLFRPVPKAAAREALGLPTNRRLILFAAAKVSTVGKGFRYFEAALHKLHSELDNPREVELLIFGAGDKGLLHELPFQYHFLGSLTDMQQISHAYNAADTFVIPSLAENLPNTIMEAMACGTPVVGFTVGGIPEMIQHRESGYLAQYKSAEDLAEGMKWLLRLPPNDYAAIAHAARQHVLAHYDEAIVAGQYASLYEGLLAGGA